MDEGTVEVVVVGSCMTDMICTVPRLPKPGETLHGHAFSVGFGGKGANQCVVAARLGANTAMVAKVGDDTFGHNYIENFKSNGVNVDFVGTTKEASTGVAQIAVDDSGQNSIVIVAGANLKLTKEDARQAEGLIASAKVVVSGLEICPDTMLEALKIAKKHGVTTILNPAPAIKELDPDVSKYSDIFCPNETEAEIMTGLPVTTIDEAKKAICKLQEVGYSTVIITLGDKGAVFATQKEHKIIHVPTTKVNPVDTTGAGDAFVGALAFYLARHPNMSLQDAIRQSCAIAAISVCKEGTQTSFPCGKDLPHDILL